MSGAHPLWPDYVVPQQQKQQQQQHATTIARASSSGAPPSTSTARTMLPGTSATASSSRTAPSLPAASSSSSIPSSSSFRRMVNNLRSTPSSPSSSTFQHASSSSSSRARNASLDFTERRSRRASLDRSRLHAAALLPVPPALPPSSSASIPDAALPRSASAFAATSSPSDEFQSRVSAVNAARASSASQQQQQQLPKHPNSVATACQDPHLPASASPLSVSFASTTHGPARQMNTAAHNDSALPLHSKQRPQHSADNPVSAYTPQQLPSPSTSSRLPSHRLHPLSSQHPQEISSPSSRTYNSPVSASSNVQALNAASSSSGPGRSSSSSNMRHTSASLDPAAAAPSSGYSSHCNAGPSRLRSGSGSIYAASRSSIASEAQVSLTVHIWWPSTTKSSSSSLARAPLFRDAAHVKQKLSMRPHSSGKGRVDEPNNDAMFGLRNHGPSWLREKPSKGRLNTPSSSIGPLGQWKRANLLFRDSGSLSILGEGNALSHSLDCSVLSTSDVRSVHDSLFSRPHVLMIQPRQPRARTEVSITTRKQEAALLQERARSSERVFVEFKSKQELQYVRTLLHIYSKPEIYGSAATIDSGGSHRFFRQLDITISDAKSIMPKWPAELNDSASDSSATPASLPRNPPPVPSRMPASLSTADAFGEGIKPGDLPRSLSHQLASLRAEDHDESPGSEPVTEDTLSGSSRAGSRPSSRLWRNQKSSASSLRATHDSEPGAGSDSSRPGSRSASRPDDSSRKGNVAGPSCEPISGSLSGQSGGNRINNPSAPVKEAAPTVVTSVVGGSGQEATSRAAALRREDKDRYEKARFDRYCRVRLDGDLVARTSLSHSGSNAFAVDKFKLKDVGDAKSLFIEVLHPTLRTSNALSGSPAHSSTKYMMLGIVEIPIDTLRRNEEIEGRFPIWSISTFPNLTQQQPSSATAAENDEDKVPSSFHRGVVGELNMSIRLHEGAVMRLSTYDEVYRRIHEDDAHGMVRELFKFMPDDSVVSHLARICAASGIIAERMSSLIEEESVNWGEKMQPELLFRANTPLSRAVDHFQRLLAPSWLDDCLGPTVRKICNDSPAQSRPDTAASTNSAGSAAGSDGAFDFSTSIRAPPTLPANAIDAIPDGPMTINSLRKLSETMWQNIYSQRHSCPPDLRTVLHRIRRKVNECYRSSKSTRPGIQGVGSFIFLRLFCASLNAPQLYGLTPSQPSRGAQRKLLLLSKVLLALASKKTSFDKEKDWELVPLNDLLRTYSSAYDDYITVVSTEPPTAAPLQLLGMRIDGDAALQAAAQRRLNSLCPLHRESVPRAPYMLDQPQALAAFVSFVADAAEEREQTGIDTGASAARNVQGDLSTASGSSEGRDRNAESKEARYQRKAAEFVQICCRIEEAAGTCVEQAGWDPLPIPFERLQRAANSNSSRYSSFGSMSSRDGQRDTLSSSPTASTDDASPRSSPSRSRSRRATVGAANTLPKMTTTGYHNQCSERDPEEPARRDARRKSIGTPRRASQLTVQTGSPSYRVTAGADPLTRTESKGDKTSNVQHTTAQPLGTSFESSTLSRCTDDEDDHGSDVELREAYRKLREEEASRAATEDRAVSGLPAVSTAAGSPAPSKTQASTGKKSPGTLQEADGDLTFEPVHAPKTAESRTLGSRASFSNTRNPAPTPAQQQAVASTTNRRHSSDLQTVARNYSLPRPSGDRNSSLYARERDGFEVAAEDAYAQTRVTLPPSASMPVNLAGSTAGATARYGKDLNGGLEKKRRWWKP